MKNKSALGLRLTNMIVFVVMVTINALANALPIAGMSTGAISDAYPNLFAPAPLTFSIWGLIYFLLALFILYQLGLFNGKSGDDMRAVKRIGGWFIVSSLANTAWIFSWHYQIIPVSIVLMVVILMSLIFTYLNIIREPLSKKEKFFVKLPFSVYFGWITVATIANATVLLVSLGWNGFGLSESLWMIVALAAGLVIGMATLLKTKDIPYGLVILWAYAGILNKHLSASGFNGQYTSVVTAVIIALAVILGCLLIAGYKRIKQKQSA